MSKQDLIDRIKVLMVEVATGQARIQERNEQYIQIYRELDKLFRDEGLENPNQLEDLWGFHSYWVAQKMQTYASRRAYVASIYKHKNIVLGLTQSQPQKFEWFVTKEIIEDLKKITDPDFDFGRLIILCEELNLSVSNGCWNSAAMLIRAILDHVPPVFGKKTFSEVANNHPAKSIRGALQSLDSLLKNLADSALHVQIWKKESVLVGASLGAFSPVLCQFLSELVRVEGIKSSDSDKELSDLLGNLFVK